MLAPTLLVDEVMRRWPGTIRVFLDRRMRCVGCPIATLHTIEDACREHDVDQRSVLADLSAAVQASDTGPSLVERDAAAL